VRYVQITFSRQVVVAGLSIQTPEKLALKEFTFSYSGRRVEFPSEVTTVQQIYKSTPNQPLVCNSSC
jgi:hypothetical protein